MVKGHYKRFSGNRILENFNAIGEGLIEAPFGYLAGGWSGAAASFEEGYSRTRGRQRDRKKWLRKSKIGSARTLYGSKPWNLANPVYGSNPRPPIYGSPPEWDPVRAKAQALGSGQIVDLIPFTAHARG